MDETSPSPPPETPTPPNPELVAVQERIGYQFRDPKWLLESLTHPSHTKTAESDSRHNQRLEFLGDAILSAVLAEHLFLTQPQEREGVLSRNRAILARGEELSRIARELNLAPAIRLGTAEDSHGGRERDSILEDAWEAMVGAVYLDGGWESARDVVLRAYGDLNARLAARTAEENPKGRLQELVQAQPGLVAPEYLVLHETGPDHEKRFHVKVLICGEPVGDGIGSSKKEAEENAARNALAHWSPKTPEEFPVSTGPSDCPTRE